MELIKNLGTKLNKKGNRESYGLFLCSYCLQEVERYLSSGKAAKSCGCKQYELISQATKGIPKTEEHNRKNSISNKGKKKTLEQRQKLSKSAKERFKNPEKHPMFGKKVSEKQKQEMSDKIKEQYKNGRQKSSTIFLLGENHIFWNNGSSFEPYAPEFNKELKNYIKTRDLNVCQTSNCMEIEHLCIHHIDYDKKNNNPENLVSLCRSCHAKTNFNRVYWTEYYSEIRGLYL